MNILEINKYKPLTNIEAEELLQIYGKNVISNNKNINKLKRLLKHLLSPLILLLLIVSLISFLSGETHDAIFIFVMVIINIIVTYIQEERAEKGLDKLKEMLSPKSKVFRDGEIKTIDSELLVIGDIVLLNAGDKVPADGIILEESFLSINESQLTGESLPVEKSQDTDIFMSTFVTSGNGIMRVLKTGMNTQIGSITKEVNEKAVDVAPIENKINNLTKHVMLIVFVLFILLISVSILQGSKIEDTFPDAIALAISSTPESLPIILLLTLSVGAYRMFKQNVILRNLPSAATLASVDVICTDKTGTLTEGKLTLTKELSFSNGKFDTSAKTRDLINIAILCNAAEITSTEEIGDLLDIAILEYANNQNYDFKKIRMQFNLISEIPFDSDYRYQATLHSNTENETKTVSVKGAIENVLPMCKLENKDDANIILKKEKELTKKGFKVIALAKKETKLNSIAHDDIKNITFCGFIVFADVIRDSVKQIIPDLIDSGIKVIMTTGDQKNAATFVAKELQILNDKNNLVINGNGKKSLEIENSELSRLAVISRSTPNQKLELIEMLQSKKHIVAMTGDGVNDAPALVKAEIGIAMGIDGTDVARESSDMVLVDNNFSSIVNGIEEARVVFENIRKVITYLFSTAIGESFVILFGLLSFGSSPLTATQILFLNLSTDGALDLAMSLEKKEKDIIKHKPARYQEQILTKKFTSRLVLLGSTMGFFALLMQDVIRTGDTIYDRSALLVFLTSIQWFVVLAARTHSTSIFSTGIFSNRAIIGVIFFSASALLAMTTLPIGQQFLGTTSVNIEIWILGIISGVAILFLEELRKKWRVFV